MGDNHIANAIRRLGFAHGEMTQQALVERIGFTRQAVNAIEQGKYSPSLEAAFQYLPEADNTKAWVQVAIKWAWLPQ